MSTDKKANVTQRRKCLHGFRLYGCPLCCTGRNQSLTVREVISELNENVKMYRDSYREVDGEIRNATALRAIAALRAAIKIVKKQSTTKDTNHTKRK